MHPAFSVIFLTTLAGVGQGLFIALYAIEVGARLGWLSPVSPSFFASGSIIAFLFLAGGLAASFFHLGRPERAWRAAAMWRTSWLSREVIVLPLFMLLTVAYGLMHYLGMPHTLVAGGASVLVCLALFVCTGMIYACIRFLQEWAHPLTVVNFTLLGCASGYTFATAFAHAVAPEVEGSLARRALVFTALAFCTRVTTLVRNGRIRPKSSLQTAIGVKHPKIAQKSQGFMGGSFNTREFFHGRTVSILRGVKWGFLACAFALPMLLIAAGTAWKPGAFAIAAFVVQYTGLLAERWYFFAQARHPQNLYYQSIS
jgi:DMSO reductase anchor subunit